MSHLKGLIPKCFLRWISSLDFYE